MCCHRRRLLDRTLTSFAQALQSSDIEVRQIATDSLSLLHSHLGSCLVRELFKELAKGSVINGDLLRFTITKRLNIAGEDVLLAETSIEETY